MKLLDGKTLSQSLLLSLKFYPKTSLHVVLVVKAISPLKDVDGLNPNSKFIPAVVIGIVKLLDSYQIGINNKNIVIVNDSDLIGQPLKKELESKGSIVTLCNHQ